MLKPYCALLIGLLLCLAGPGHAELQLLTEEAPPTSFSRDGELHGLAVEVVRALIERTGDPGKIELVPWTRGYHLAQHEPNTAIFTTVRTPEREARFQWVGPLAVPKQWYTFETLSARGFKNLYGVASSKNMVAMLKHGRVQLIATEDLTLEDELASGGLRPDQVQEHLPFMRSAYYIAFSPQTDAGLVERWQRALEGMHQDGSFAQIFRRWLPHAELPTATERSAAPRCAAC